MVASQNRVVKEEKEEEHHHHHQNHHRHNSKHGKSWTSYMPYHSKYNAPTPLSYSTPLPQQGMTTEKAAVSSPKKILWSRMMDCCLAELLVEQVHLGRKAEHGFMTQAWKEVLEVLNERLKMHLTFQHCKNRLRTWRKRYMHVNNLLRQRGFKWNDSLKCVMAEEQVWDNYCKAHPNIAAYRYKTIELYNEMALIFGNDLGFKRYSRAGTEIKIDESTPRTRAGAEKEIDGNTPRSVGAEIEIDQSNPRLDSQCILEGSPLEPHEARLLDGQESDFSDSGTKGTSSASERSDYRDLGPPPGFKQRKKRKRNVGDLLAESLSQMAGAMTELAAAWKREDEVSKMRQLCEEVKKIQNISTHLILKALDFFSKEPTKAMIFLALDEDLRREWLLMFVRE